MKRFTYRDKRTGRKIHSDTPLDEKQYVLVVQLRDGQMKGKAIHTK